MRNLRSYVYLVLAFILSPASFAMPVFLQLHGQIAGKPNPQISRELHDLLLAPLESNSGAILYSHVTQASGDGIYFINLILEPSGPTQQKWFDEYLAKREGMDFYGMPVHFERVQRIDEVAELEAGIYVDNRQDPFQNNYQLARNFSFSSVRDWLAFSNGYGFALLGNHDELMNFLRNFIGDPQEFSNFRDGAMSVSNMLAIFPQVSLVLENGTVTSPDFSETPFLPYRFFRNCYSSRYENGMCRQNPP